MINYRIIRQNRKTASIRVEEDLTVSVRIPYFMKEKELHTFIEQHEAWILRTIEQKKDKKLQRDWLTTGKILYLGDYKKVKIQYSSREKIEIQDEWLILTTKEGQSEERLRLQMKEFFREKAKELLPEFTKYYAQLLGVNVNRITIREQKTRWGSCSSRGNIAYNLHLIGAPEACIHYVVLHEVMHLRFFNHSLSFWKGIEEIMPDYKQRMNDLKLFGQNFSI
ncbi:M48 family metallopeptidase [Sporanaerobium hydrogeniformans]|uniref:M48 family metallopeptidase n=1 Tax=Sporanaerobium hydrogeniformans TaxID=3072179 RepID=UPI0015D4FD41|nr:SprT family zinc-dependent metalloprotease [Sporanaerobium hydrogeniformans]